jgi:hypothetical protein
MGANDRILQQISANNGILLQMRANNRILLQIIGFTASECK